MDGLSSFWPSHRVPNQIVEADERFVGVGAEDLTKKKNIGACQRVPRVHHGVQPPEPLPALWDGGARADRRGGRPSSLRPARDGVSPRDSRGRNSRVGENRKQRKRSHTDRIAKRREKDQTRTQRVNGRKANKIWKAFFESHENYKMNIWWFTLFSLI